MKFLITGLGNIGAKYESTRHNIGFEVLDALAQKNDASFKLERFAYHSTIKYKGKKLELIKPTTYMNLSGKSVRYWMQILKIPQENLLVIVDDINLPFGKLRLKPKGSAGGHNGLEHIQQLLGNSNYTRLRFGVGDNFGKGQQARYVLSRWTEDEGAELPNHIDKAIEIIQSFAAIGLQRTMNEFN